MAEEKDHQKKQRGFAWQTDETHLRKVETEVLIPKKMRDKAKVLCDDKVQAFNECCSSTGILMAFKCRKENSELKECITGYYVNNEFFEECKKEYLAERQLFRTTGVSPAKKEKRKH